jgi:hypothetical protein
VIITCPKCFSAHEVLPPRGLPDHLLQYRCTNPVHGEHEWLTTRGVVQATGDVQGGVTDDLLEPLYHCVDPNDPFVQYGIVEYRLHTRFPDRFAAHVANQGHSMFGSRAYHRCVALQRPGDLLGPDNTTRPKPQDMDRILRRDRPISRMDRR